MRLYGTIRLAGLLTIALTSALLLPRTAHARACISTILNDTCLTNCLAERESSFCGSSPACHQELASELQQLATLRSGSQTCSGLVSLIRLVCGCLD